MRDKYVHVQDSYANLQHDYIDMQENSNQINII